MKDYDQALLSATYTEMVANRNIYAHIESIRNLNNEFEPQTCITQSLLYAYKKVEPATIMDQEIV